MALHNCQGIVLYSRIINESDISAEMLSDNAGIDTFIFKSLKKSSKRPQAVIEPGTLADFTFYKKGGGFCYVSDFRILQHPSDIAKSYDKVLILLLMLEIVRKTSGNGVHDSFLFHFLRRAIARLSATKNQYMLFIYFILHLLRHGGILPDLTKPLIITLEKSCLELRLSPEEYTFTHLALHSHFDDSCAISVESFERIAYNLLLYIENYFSITLNSKKLLFSASYSNMLTALHVAEPE